MHKHHIVPKHAGGTNNPENLIELTVEEHAEAHRILYEENGCWQDRIAWQALSGQIGKEEAKRLATCFSNKNRVWTNEAKQKLAESASKQWKGVPKSKEHKENIRQANTGKIFTEERKRNISLACKGRVAHNKGAVAPIHYCKHCKRNIAGYSNFTRWHNDNCKENLNAR